MLSSYYLLEFSTDCFMSLGSNNVFYRKTKVKRNLALHCLTDQCVVLGGCGWLVFGFVFVLFFMDKHFMGQ